MISTIPMRICCSDGILESTRHLVTWIYVQDDEF
jgi:hypothetical protein